MVIFCCIKGCCNNTKHGTKSKFSFYAFPLNPLLRKKWLWAIGRLDWEPPSYARVCSAHFSPKHMIQKGDETIIKSNACPLNILPFQGEKLAPEEVCKVCLVSDVKMYSLKDGKMRLYMDSVPGFTENFTDGMPQSVCCECAVQLKKCWRFMEKSTTSKKILLDILSENGQIDKTLLNIYREYLKLKPQHTYHEETPMTLYNYKYADEQNISILTNIQFIAKVEEKEDDVRYIRDQIYKPDTGYNVSDIFQNDALNEEVFPNIDVDSETKKVDSDCEVISHDHEEEAEIYVVEVNDNVNDDDDVTNSDPIDVFAEPFVNVKTEVIEIPEQICCVPEAAVRIEEKPPENSREIKVQEVKSLRTKELTVEENVLQEDFNVIKLNAQTPANPTKAKVKEKRSQRKKRLQFEKKRFQEQYNIIKVNTLQEQIDAWKEFVGGLESKGGAELIKCELCSKVFVTRTAFENHMTGHDPSRGNFECPVCKLKYKSPTAVLNHVHYAHSLKFHCRSCTKVFRSVTAAKTHQLLHSGYQYKCKQCSYHTTDHSSFRRHINSEHADVACEICGRNCINANGLLHHQKLVHAGYTEPEGGEVYPCEDCNFKFKSENALRVHLLNSFRHKDAIRESQALRTACKHCGVKFQQRYELSHHMNVEHLYKQKLSYNPRIRTREIHKDNANVQNIECEYCDAKLTSRRQHYLHVAKKHPAHRADYKAEVNAVCETCGKGFSNMATLRLHEIQRHAESSVRCEQCGRMFRDDVALWRHHARGHRSLGPFTCDDCGRSFNSKSNLTRHMMIHRGVMPYPCSICGKKFRQRSTMKLHVRTVHMKMPHPPRKKRKPKARHKNVTANDNDTT